MAQLSIGSTVGEVVAELPSSAPVLGKLGIDYCCGGKQSIASVCAERGLDAHTLLCVLEASSAAEDREPYPSCASMGLSELVDHVEGTHHAFMKEHLPRLDALSIKVERVHAGSHPELRELRQLFGGLRDELSQHLAKEEQILFPMIRQLDGAEALPAFHCGSVGNRIGVMEEEHDRAGQVLARMREVTDGYVAPEDGCASYQALLKGLAELELDLHQHIHKENNILFPKAVGVERNLSPGGTKP